jgi:hypothetical protein
MKADGALPMVEQSGRGLGVRADGKHADVHPDAEGLVHPGAGMSVAPDDPMLLQQHRRPIEYGGTGDDPLWMIIDEDLSEEVTVQLRQAAWGGIQGLLLKRSVSAVMAGMSFLRVVER